MNNPIRSIPVFIASPGDVKKERRIAAAAINHLSTSLRHTFRVGLQTLEWRDFAPISHSAHPQKAILKNIEPDSIFIGILHKRYGTPIGEMAKRSGTEAEFDYAIANRKRIKILTYFKCFKGQARSRLQTKQIRLLSRLKRRLARRKIFYQEFRTAAEFSERIFGDILQSVIEMLMAPEQQKREHLAEFFKFGCHHRRVGERPSVRTIYPPMHRVMNYADKRIWLNWQRHLCPLVVYEDMKAFQKIESCLHSIGIRDYASVTTTYITQYNDKDANRIWVCVPRNERAHKIMAHLGERVKFRFGYEGKAAGNSANRHLAWKNSHGEIIVKSPLNRYLELSKTRPNGEHPWESGFADVMAKDYAIIARFAISSPQAVDDKFFYHYFVGGIRGLGTWGAAWYIDRYPEKLAALSRKLHAGDLQVLVEVTYLDRRIVKVEDVSYMPQDYFDRQMKDKLILETIQRERKDPLAS